METKFFEIGEKWVSQKPETRSLNLTRLGHSWKICLREGDYENCWYFTPDEIELAKFDLPARTLRNAIEGMENPHPVNPEPRRNDGPSHFMDSANYHAPDLMRSVTENVARMHAEAVEGFLRSLGATESNAAEFRLEIVPSPSLVEITQVVRNGVVVGTIESKISHGYATGSVFIVECRRPNDPE